MLLLVVVATTALAAVLAVPRVLAIDGDFASGYDSRIAPRAQRVPMPGPSPAARQIAARAKFMYATSAPKPAARTESRGIMDGPLWTLVLASVALSVFASVLAGAGALAVCVCLRLRARRRRVYRRYPIYLSNQDEAKALDLKDMVEAMGNAVRELPWRRATRGQPWFAIEAHVCKTPAGNLEYLLSVVCEARHVKALDGAIAGAYSDVRVGWSDERVYRPLPWPLAEAGAVFRYRKARPFIYSLVDVDELGSGATPLLQPVAEMQYGLGVPSTVRIQLTPLAPFMERFARWAQRRHERRLARSQAWGPRDAGLSSQTDREEMRQAAKITGGGLFSLEVLVAGPDAETCKAIGGALQARHGHNSLRRQLLCLRRELYRRRFPTAIPPLLPSPRSFASAAEVACLIELPSGSMKNVPTRRVVTPRMPAPTHIRRGELDPYHPGSSPQAP
jgi:hypothetical protein